MLATRVSNSFCPTPALVYGTALLVRIYPQQGIGEPFELAEPRMTIGRDECTLTLPDDSVSRRHAMLEWLDGGHLLTDLGSTNGTYVNEQRISSQRLAVGDRVRFGKQIFKYLTTSDIESQYHEVVYKIMTTDGLTQIYNRPYFMEALEREMETSARSGSPLSVLMIDLDRFKTINDQYGHLAGDAVLTEFATRARSVLRCGEVLARYGGEEFAMLCLNASLSDANRVAERVRAAIAATPVEFPPLSIPVTVSIGCACTNGHSPRTAKELIAQADQWLYLAKESGRNQVRSAAHG
jgi:diguanylate cyclase (GGDEF)-like protein